MEAAVAGHRDLNHAGAPGAAADDSHACATLLREALMLVAAVLATMEVLLLRP